MFLFELYQSNLCDLEPLGLLNFRKFVTVLKTCFIFNFVSFSKQTPILSLNQQYSFGRTADLPREIRAPIRENPRLRKYAALNTRSTCLRQVFKELNDQRQKIQLQLLKIHRRLRDERRKISPLRGPNRLVYHDPDKTDAFADRHPDEGRTFRRP